MNILKLRLESCIQTVMDFQPMLGGIYKRNLLDDFLQLSEWLDESRDVELDEEQISRLERLTSEFIREMGCAGYHLTAPAREYH